MIKKIKNSVKWYMHKASKANAFVPTGMIPVKQ